MAFMITGLVLIIFSLGCTMILILMLNHDERKRMKEFERSGDKWSAMRCRISINANLRLMLLTFMTFLILITFLLTR